MLKEVRRVLDGSGETLLTYLLDMATVEAEERANSIQYSD